VPFDAPYIGESARHFGTVTNIAVAERRRLPQLRMSGVAAAVYKENRCQAA
jgi:hypothetical protein